MKLKFLVEKAVGIVHSVHHIKIIGRTTENAAHLHVFKD